mmetsp:Transcript_38086/g.61070  ORF Transcript_38086/g.61070 Transcript_38086/m.61070 type:complete len:201 (+) Transcript_38086:277-879(+)
MPSRICRTCSARCVPSPEPDVGDVKELKTRRLSVGTKSRKVFANFEKETSLCWGANNASNHCNILMRLSSSNSDLVVSILANLSLLPLSSSSFVVRSVQTSHTFRRLGALSVVGSKVKADQPRMHPTKSRISRSEKLSEEHAQSACTARTWCRSACGSCAAMKDIKRPRRRDSSMARAATSRAAASILSAIFGMVVSTVS